MYKDYFFASILPDETVGIRPDIRELINTDIRNYREHTIKQYNGDVDRGTDEFCFRKFLNEYSTAINVLGLHKEYNCRHSFNKYIDFGYRVVNGDEEFDYDVSESEEEG